MFNSKHFIELKLVIRYDIYKCGHVTISTIRGIRYHVNNSTEIEYAFAYNYAFKLKTSTDYFCCICLLRYMLTGRFCTNFMKERKASYIYVCVYKRPTSKKRVRERNFNFFENL